MSKTFKAVILASTALALPAFAATPSDPRVTVLEQELRDVQSQLAQIKATQAGAAEASDNSAALADLKRSTSAQYSDINARLNSQANATVDNGRLTIASADGRFSASVRGLFQFDTGYFMQSQAGSLLPASYGNDFGSGSNFRRVYLGLSGKVFGDWTYNLNFDFGGSGGTETPGHIQSVYLEYDGLAPWGFRVGAFPPPTSVEDATSAGDTIFLERNSPSDVQRNIAGGDGRDAFTLLYASPSIYGAVSYTGNKVQDGAKALAAAGATVGPNFDEQEATVGRLSWLPINQPGLHWLIGVNGTYVIKPPDLVANGLATLNSSPTAALYEHTISLSDPPEFTFDSNGYTLVNSGALPANHITQWGVETAGNWGSLYGQAGYYGFELDRAPQAVTRFTAPGVSSAAILHPSNDNFSGWYVQGTWLLTGEERPYNVATGAFTMPKVLAPLNFDRGTWGAFELALRYSDLDLNDHELDASSVVTGYNGVTPIYTFYNTVRGGDQRIATAGINWYPNNVVRFALNYELIQNSRLQSPAAVTTAGTPVLPTVNGGQNMSAVALRAQLSL